MLYGLSSDALRTLTDQESQYSFDAFGRKTGPGSPPEAKPGAPADPNAGAASSVLPRQPAERDRFEISPEMQVALEKAGQAGKAGASEQTKKSGSPSSAEELSPEAQKVVAVLKSADQRVRTHEMAHLAAAGGLARGGASYTFQTGPDGHRYAVAGEVNVDSRPVDGDARATLSKAYQIQRAALAPADPSPQDRAVAAAAASMAAQALAELNRQNFSIKKTAQASATQPAQKQSSFRLAQDNQPVGKTHFDVSA